MFARVTTILAVFGAAVFLIAGRASGAPQTGDYRVLLPMIYEGLEIEIEPFVVGLPAVTAITHAGDERLFATIRDGRIFILEPDGRLQVEPFLDIRDRVETGFWEQGLLGLVFDPDYASNGIFYIYYAAKLPGMMAPAVLARYTADPASSGPVDPATEEILLTIPKEENSHYGGDLHFGPDGYLYVAVGDDDFETLLNWNAPLAPPNSQNGTNLLGKILRLDVHTTDGSPYAIPPDNPFVADETIRDEIWLLGLRNPWRFSFDRLTGEMYIGDVGRSLWEEVNRVAAGQGGLNLGWPCYEAHFNGPARDDCGPRSDYVFPIHAFNHLGSRCSITGGYVYRGQAEPALTGRYLFADLCTGTVWALSDDPQGEVRVAQVGQFPDHRWTTFGEDRAGEIYLGEWHGALTIFRIVIK